MKITGQCQENVFLGYQNHKYKILNFSAHCVKGYAYNYVFPCLKSPLYIGISENCLENDTSNFFLSIVMFFF